MGIEIRLKIVDKKEQLDVIKGSLLYFKEYAITTDAVGVAIIIVITPKLILESLRIPKWLTPKIIPKIKIGIRIVFIKENCQATEFFKESLIDNSESFKPAANQANGEHSPAKKERGLYIQKAVLSILKNA